MKNEIKYCNKEGTEESPCECEIVEIKSLSLKMYSRSSGPDGIRWGLKKEDVKEFIRKRDDLDTARSELGEKEYIKQRNKLAGGDLI